jgi:hypothetical protein
MNRLQEQSKFVDDVFDNIRQLMEKWKNKLTLANLRLVERYVKGELRIHVVFATVAKDYIAEFQACRLLGFKLKVDGEGTDLLWRCRGKFVIERDGKQEAMLVDNVKTMENPERTIPSLVRFQEADRFYRVFPHALYFSAKSAFTSVGFRRLKDWESAVVAGPRTIRADQLVHKMVKRCTEIVDNIAGNHRQRKRDAFKSVDPVFPYAGLTVMLEPESVGLRVDERLLGALKVKDMLFGPF